MTPRLLLLLLPVLAAGQELLQNADFESTDFSGNWYATDCDIAASSDSLNGSHSIEVTNRHHDWSGVSQNVQVQQNHRYLGRCYIKILNMQSGHLYETVQLMVDVEDSNGQHHYEFSGKNPRVTSGAWHAIGGDILISSSVKNARMYVEVVGSPSVNFRVDSCSFMPLPGLANYPNDADQRIDQIRKANIKVTLGGNLHPSGLQVQIHQNKSDFGWGTAVAVSAFNDPNQNAYRQYIYDNFEWAVFENALKWPYTERQQGHPNYDAPMKAWNTLNSHGITVRGHNIAWAVDRWVPNWQNGMSGDALRNAVSSRVQSVVGTFKGKLAHWDVNNENLHGDFYAQKLHDADFTNWLFRQAHNVDPNVKLFLNEYSIVASNEVTMAEVDQALQMKSKGVPVYGIGIQSHLNPPVSPDTLQYRLDELATAGLPLWVTELDIKEQDENKKAQYYEDALRIYFAHPKVEGVMFWGFSDQHHWIPQAALTTGSSMTPNAAGRRVHHLIRELWRTDETHDLSPGQEVSVRGFKGQYQLLVKHHGKVIHQENFHNGDQGATLTVNLSGNENNPHVNNVIVG